MNKKLIFDEIDKIKRKCCCVCKQLRDLVISETALAEGDNIVVVTPEGCVLKPFDATGALEVCTILQGLGDGGTVLPTDEVVITRGAECLTGTLPTICEQIEALGNSSWDPDFAFYPFYYDDGVSTGCYKGQIPSLCQQLVAFGPSETPIQIGDYILTTDLVTCALRRSQTLCEQLQEFTAATVPDTMLEGDYLIGMRPSGEDPAICKLFDAPTICSLMTAIGDPDPGEIPIATDKIVVIQEDGSCATKYFPDIVNALQLMGIVGFDAAEPGAPNDGDVYIFNTAGTNTWEGSTVVEVGDQAVYFSGAWYFIQANVVQASETIAGVAEIATQVETNAGVDDTRIVTPLKLANYVAGATAYSVVPLTFADSPYTVLPTSGDVRYLVDATGGNVLITLPTAIANTAQFTFKKIDASANTVDVDGAGAETIDSVTNQTILFQNTVFSIFSDNANWWRSN